MSNTRGAAEFFKNLLRTIDIDTIPNPISERMNLALDVMYDVGGKPSSSHVVQVYDALMQTPQTSVYCHSMMLTRRISSNDWVKKTIAENGDGLWMIHNPVDSNGNTINPFEYTHQDLTPIANQIQYPMRIETWVADAPTIHPDSLPASPYQPVIELRHPDWEMDGYPLAVWMDWYERDGEPQSRYRIVFHECPEITKELRKKLEALSLKVDEALPKKQKEKMDEVFVGLANYISQVNLSVISNHQ